VTKSDLIECVALEAGLTKGRAELVINTIFDAMLEALAHGDGIEIRGFGSFTVRQYKPYEGRNPRTGSAVHVAPKRLPFFKVGKELRERVNGRSPPEGAKPAVLPVTEPARVTRPAMVATPKPAAARRSVGENSSEDVI